jgi:hypothetical protein
MRCLIQQRGRGPREDMRAQTREAVPPALFGADPAITTYSRDNDTYVTTKLALTAREAVLPRGSARVVRVDS